MRASMVALREVEKASRALQEATRKLNAVRAARKIKCSCGKYHAIGKLTLVITHWYVAPYSCSDGDYWTEGEWNFRCPTDGFRNRLLFNDYGVSWDRRNEVGTAPEPTFKHLYRHLFASQEYVYERGDGPEAFNNWYVDKNRKRFELPERM